MARLPTSSMLDYWWVPVARGLAAIVLGILTFVWPGISVLAFVTLVAAYWIVDGGISVYHAIKWKRWGWPLWGGVVSLVAGGLALLRPGVAVLSIVIVMAVWAILRGLLDIYVAISMRKEIDYEWWLALSGVTSVVLGGLILMKPAAGAMAMVALLGTFAIIIGAFLVAAGLRLRKHRYRGSEPTFGIR